MNNNFPTIKIGIGLGDFIISYSQSLYELEFKVTRIVRYEIFGKLYSTSIVITYIIILSKRYGEIFVLIYKLISHKYILFLRK